MDRGNDQVIGDVQRYPDRLLGYVTINADDSQGVTAECERCWSGGCRELKLHSNRGLDSKQQLLDPGPRRQHGTEEIRSRRRRP